MNDVILQKHYQFEVKSVADDGTFEGYASVTGNTDSDGEVIDSGAFARTLDHKKGIVPILWQHKREEPIGWNQFAEEDSKGLRVKGKLMLDTERGRQAHSFMKAGLALGGQPGLSVGFTVPKNGDYMKDGVRHFKEVAWKEYSVVTFPANDEARVTSAKAAKTKRVDGMDLTASCFAYVGDPDKTETWKLPIRFPGNDAKTKSHIRNALARFSQTQGIPDTERASVLAKIKRAAKAAGIDTGKAAQDFNSSLEEMQALDALWDERYAMDSAFRDAVCDNMEDDSLPAEEKKTAIATSLDQYCSALKDWYSRFVDANDDGDDDEDEPDDDMSDDEKAEFYRLKEGRTISNATGAKITSALNHLKEAQMHVTSVKASHGKAIGVLQDVLPVYYANDVNLPNPAGKGDAETLHSLLEATRGLTKSLRTQK
jgi:HK97 family phage prohead protease